ncbi:MAG: hypothetical protein NUV49_02570 [Patescibacteria group bacterium]|nr:hypothetical protein [Patescibacteria group bacterium]
METDLKKRVEELERQVKLLTSKRITQDMLVPDVIKTRHLGEANRYIINGDVADLPDRGDDTAQGTQAYFAKDESKLYIWNRDSEVWESTTLA